MRLYSIPIATLLLIVPLFSGCGAHVSSHQSEVGFAPTSSETSVELQIEAARSLLEQLAIEGSSESDLRRALGVIAQLERLEGESFELTARKSAILLFIVEPMNDGREIVRLCRRGELLAESMREQSPDRVEGYYYGAMFMGLRARQQTLRAAFRLGDIEEQGRRAVELDPAFDDAGPLRFLGMFLLNAPSFPYGPGDPDEGVELLERATTLSEYPLNRLLLARGLVELDEDETACEALTAAFSAPSEGRWARTRDRWQTEAEQLATQISCPVRTLPGFALAD